MRARKENEKKSTLTIQLHPSFAVDVLEIMEEAQKKIEEAYAKRSTMINSQGQVFKNHETVIATFDQEN